MGVATRDELKKKHDDHIVGLKTNFDIAIAENATLAEKLSATEKLLEAEKTARVAVEKSFESEKTARASENKIQSDEIVKLKFANNEQASKITLMTQLLETIAVAAERRKEKV